MGLFVANKVVKLMIQKGITIKGAKALVLGVTFKENCPDIRNSKVIDIYNELIQFGLDVDVYDPHADANEVNHEYGISLVSTPLKYDSVILAVAHDEFIHMNMSELKKSENCVVFDIKAILDRNQIDGRL
jgi:UDP-N-acetyl-D-galactosamine dehydrogenase